MTILEQIITHWAADLRDFEDAVLYAAALNAKLDGIVTRNPKDFKQNDIQIYVPDALLG